MGVIKGFLGIVILLAIAVFGYWLYASYTLTNTDDEIWMQINGNLPDPLREWSCKEVNTRIKTAEAPAGCAGFWDTASVPAIEQPAPAEPITPPADATASPPPYNN